MDRVTDMLYVKMFLKNAFYALLLLALAITLDAYVARPHAETITNVAKTVFAIETAPKPSLHYKFSVDGVLNESGSPTLSTSPYFWLNSGGQLVLKGGVGATIHGALPLKHVWQTLYALGNALDTGDGLYPQNLFRLITKSTWKDFDQSVRFKIDAVNETDTANRDGYSGILLMSRYKDGDNLYYAGVRMDGTAVIKKKLAGTYYTLASGPAFEGTFSRTVNPNLIPEGTWMALKSVVTTTVDGGTKIELYIDRHDRGSWERLLSANDTPGANGSKAIVGPARAGIRTDYLDVSFDDYKLSER